MKERKYYNLLLVLITQTKLNKCLFFLKYQYFKKIIQVVVDFLKKRLMFMKNTE